MISSPTTALIILSALSICDPVALAFRVPRRHTYRPTRRQPHGHHHHRPTHSPTHRPTPAPVPPEEPWLLSAAERTWEYFKEPYPDPPDNISEEVKKTWTTLRFKAICGVERPNHGIPNAVRKAILVPYVIEAYSKLYGGRENNYKIPNNYKAWLTKESFAFSPDMIRAAQVAVMFEVVGRQAEIGFNDDFDMYQVFRLDSYHALEAYGNYTLGPAELKDVLDGTWQMYKPPVSKSSYTYQRIFEKVHDLELLRCWGHTQMEYKIKQLEQDLGVSAAKKLLLYTEQMIEATGDNVQWRPSGKGGRKRWKCRKFHEAGRHAAKSFEFSRRVTPPKFDVDEDLPLPSALNLVVPDTTVPEPAPQMTPQQMPSSTQMTPEQVAQSGQLEAPQQMVDDSLDPESLGIESLWLD